MVDRGRPHRDARDQLPCVVTISRRLGHATPNVTLQIYAHLFRKRDDKAAAAINDAINGALARPVGL
jgi:integrase